MKLISEKRSLELLRTKKDAFRRVISEEYEHAAKSCETCETPGACCLDAHFVNVHISRLEAVAINEILGRLAPAARDRVEKRVEESIHAYGLTCDGDTFARPFACPLFERSIGCLVHLDGKPLPCIQHACYENESDLPPSELLAEKEIEVEALNHRTYGSPQPWLPIPIALKRWR